MCNPCKAFTVKPSITRKIIYYEHFFSFCKNTDGPWGSIVYRRFIF